MAATILNCIDKIYPNNREIINERFRLVHSSLAKEFGLKLERNVI